MTFTPSRRLLATALAGSLALAALPVVPALAGTPHQDLQAQVDGLVGVGGALAHVRDAKGTSLTVVSGTAERGTGRPMVSADGSFRVASVTKTIMAATVVRLAEQHKIELTAPVERYLPGVVRGTGEGAAIDGHTITVRDLLQQTSGLPEFTDAVDWTDPDPDFLKIALARTPTQRGRFSYANTNYLVAGLIVNAVTGRDFREVSRDLVLRPLGMRGTYWPARNDTGLRAPYAHTYGVHPANPEGGVVDVTEMPGYLLGASGGLVSTPRDLNTFWRSLPTRTFKTMTGRTVAIDSAPWPPGARYGLGVARAKGGCGTYWFHGGDLPGVSVLSGKAASGRQATVYATSTAGAKQVPRLLAAFGTALCG